MSARRGRCVPGRRGAPRVRRGCTRVAGRRKRPRLAAALLPVAALIAASLCARPASAQVVEPDTLRLPKAGVAPPARADRDAAARPDSLMPVRDGVRVTDREGERTPADTADAFAVQPDSIMRALLELEGYAATRYEGSGAVYGVDSGRITLQGPAVLERQGQTIEADSLITYSQQTNVVCGYGSPVLSGEGTPIQSDQLCYDVGRRLGMAVGARTQFEQNATWYVHGERVYTAGSERIYSADAEFTTCDLEVPHYHFRAGRFKIVQDEILVASDVTLRFGDVPVFWLPFLVQSMEDGRHSGLLTPSFGLSDVVQTGEGQTRNISNLGVFWAINDYMGSELAFDWRSNDYIAMRALFQYRWLRQFLNGSINVRQFWSDGGRQLALNTNNSWQPDERTTVNVTGRYASSSEFVADRSYSPSELSRSLLANAGVRRRFDWGSASLSASRNQRLLEERVTLNAPIFSLSLNSMTLASPRLGGEPVDLVWSGSGSFESSYQDVDQFDPSGTLRDSRVHDVSAGSSFQFGRLSWSQTLNAQDEVLDPRPELIGADDDEVYVLPRVPETQARTLDWSTNLTYQQNLIGTATISPRVGLSGEVVESPETAGDALSSPIAFNFGATLRGDLFGFWPGVGPFDRLRHRLSPSITYNYRPAARPTLTQQAVFGDGVRRQSTISLTLNQTFEAKRPEEETAEQLEQAVDPDAPEALEERPDAARRAGAGGQADAAAGAQPGEPQRLERQAPVTLLSISTSAIAYDFERASRGETGLTTTSVTNTLRTDLLRDFQLSLRHDLFATTNTIGEDGATVSDREFDLHLSSLTARFGFGGDAWLFRWLGLGGEVTERPEDADPDTLNMDIVPQGANSGNQMVPGSGGLGQRGLGGGPVGSVGTWRTNLNYSLSRPRVRGQDTNQLLRADFAFQPTENWSVHWTTGYSLSDSDFTDNALTLTRTLHRWQADFRLLRAQNGNFSFEFEARLSDLPDLKIPYDQRSNPNLRRD